MYIFRKRLRKLKTLFFLTFRNSAPKIETSLAKNVMKPILESRNAKMLLVCMVYSFLDKKLKKYNLRKE